MKSRRAQFAAAAVLVLAIYVCLQIPRGLVTPAYALQDTIDAYSSIRWLHVKEFTMVDGEKWDSESWIECDDYGKPRRFRHQAYQVSTGNRWGPITAVHDGNGTDVWLLEANICYRVSSQAYLDAIHHLQWDITETDPKLLCEQLHDQQERGESVLAIEEPISKDEPIVITVTYPQESLSAGSKKVLYIDQATTLVKKLELLQCLPDGSDQLIRSIEFFDYNQEIDPGMFSLKGELPEDVIWVDQSDKEIGLVQGDMTDEQIAVEVTRQFFEAFVAEDYDRAGLLWGGLPGFFIRGLIPDVRVLQITSIGEAHREGNSNAMVSSCELLVDVQGLELEVDAHMVRTRPVSSQPVRWVINGIGTRLKPPEDYVPGTITLSQTQADLSAVTYDGLKPGDFMQKWLLLEPIKLEFDTGTYLMRDKVLQDEFAADQLDATEFDPNVIIGDKTYRWSLLESDQGKVNLADEYQDDYMMTYAWAQINMPNEQQGILGIGSDDAVKVWLNGELVHENWISRGVVVDNDRVPVTFKKGMNQLVLKVQNHLLGWGFCCRLMEE